MASTVRRIGLPVVALALLAACDRTATEQVALDPRLEQDLALASAAAVELAPAPATTVATAEELAPRSEPTRATRAAPRQVRRSTQPSPAPERIVTPQEAEAPAPAPEPVMVAEAPSEDPVPVLTPVAAPRPRAPEVIPASGPDLGDGAGRGPGVVIRGGVGGVDDCAVHDIMMGRGRLGGITVSINDRVPGVRGTFPNRMREVSAAPRVEVSRPMQRGGTLRPRGFR